MTDKLSQILSQVYAVDHTIHGMFTMVKVSGQLQQLGRSSLSSAQNREYQKGVEALKLYLMSAIGFLRCLFGNDI